MNRHLCLILNYGSLENSLPNVRADRDNYLNYFMSPEGGAWGENELSVYENDFHFTTFARFIAHSRQIGAAYDFLLIVFCGHGYSDEYGRRWFEVRPDDKPGACVCLTQFEAACAGTRTLMITDSCLGLWTPSLPQTRLNSFTNEGIRGISSYEDRCRKLYNDIILSTPKDTFVASFAVSLNETASDNIRGGIYSQNLLDVARETISYLKSPESNGYNHASIAYVHGEAARRVASKTYGKQHPEIIMPRSKNQLPFVVVPKIYSK